MGKIPTISRNRLTREAEVKEYLRAMNDRVLNGTPYPGLNFGVYSNTGGHGSMKLPPSGRNQEYFEGRAGLTRNGAPGRYRFVFLVDNPNGIKPKIIKRYYTTDHYDHFFEIID